MAFSEILHNLNLDKRHKLLGFQKNNGIFQLVNGLLMYAKFLIYQCNYSKSKCKPKMAQYNSIRKSEYFTAKNKHDLDTHDRKWAFLR